MINYVLPRQPGFNSLLSLNSLLSKGMDTSNGLQWLTTCNSTQLKPYLAKIKQQSNWAYVQY